MKKNIIIAILFIAFSSSLISNIQAGQQSWSWTVPGDVKKIIVSSAINGKEIFSKTISVTPGQTITVEKSD